jgi:hypothetical protein
VCTLQFSEPWRSWPILLIRKNVSARPISLRTFFTFTGVRAKKRSKCSAYIRFVMRSKGWGSNVQSL